jgi:hypothetical protein
MEQELEKKYKISYAIAHTCVEGAKKQLNISSDAEAQEKHDQVMAKAEEIYQNLPTTSGQVSAAQPFFFEKTRQGLKEFGKDTGKFLGERAAATKYHLGLDDKKAQEDSEK